RTKRSRPRRGRKEESDQNGRRQHGKRGRPVPPKQSNPVYAIVLLHGGKHVESLWVRKVRGMHYRVAAIHFYAYNISFGDIVLCGRDEDGRGLFVVRVVKKSG